MFKFFILKLDKFLFYTIEEELNQNHSEARYFQLAIIKSIYFAMFSFFYKKVSQSNSI